MIDTQGINMNSLGIDLLTVMIIKITDQEITFQGKEIQKRSKDTG